jgi:hypothetical protein
MVSSTEGIGRLITNEVLLQTERQLLRNQDEPGQQQQEEPAQPPPPPISYNDKAVASVLMTLLEEQLDAAMVNLRGPPGDVGPTRPASADATPAATRIAAHYAEADAVFRPDLPAQQIAAQSDAANQQALLAAASPELRMAMQSAFLSAAVRAKADFETAPDGTVRGRRSAPEASILTPFRVRLGLCAAIILAIVFFAKFIR